MRSGKFTPKQYLKLESNWLNISLGYDDVLDCYLSAHRYINFTFNELRGRGCLKILVDGLNLGRKLLLLHIFTTVWHIFSIMWHIFTKYFLLLHMFLDIFTHLQISQLLVVNRNNNCVINILVEKSSTHITIFKIIFHLVHLN